MKLNCKFAVRALTALLFVHFLIVAQAEPYAPVAKLFAEHCVDCHASDDPEGKLVLEDFESLMKGGENGAAIIPGKSSESLLMRMIEGTYERDGKVRFMPPGKRTKLTPAEVAVIKGWIDAGAKAPTPEELELQPALSIPEISPVSPPAHPVFAMAYEPKSKLLALGRPGVVEFHSAEAQLKVRSVPAPGIHFNAVVFAPDGKSLWAAGGENGIGGEIRQWTLEGTELRSIKGHRDSIYALAISPDGQWLATGSYDQSIKIWNTKSGEELRTLTGHNGCVYALSFRADGKILASASGDRTVKLWDVATGERRDTLAQSLKELYSVAFSPDGKRLAAAGVDSRIRVWEISESASETTNPLLYSKFAHDSPILKVMFSSDGKLLASAAEDRTVKIWEAAEVRENRLLEEQPDWVAALAFILDNHGLAAGRLDGSVAYYDLKDGSALLPPKPEIARVHPRGVQRGAAAAIRITGKYLQHVDGVKVHHPHVKAHILPSRDADESSIKISVMADASMARQSVDFVLTARGQESGSAKLHIDDIPQFAEAPDSTADVALPIPAAFWGVHNELGDRERVTFKAKEGQTLVFDAASTSIGSKAGLLLDLVDASGRVIRSSNGFDASGEPLFAHTFEAAGEYALEIAEHVLAASEDHFYRVSIGEFRLVTGTFPSLVSPDRETEVQLIGFNLNGEERRKVSVIEGKAALALDSESYRWRQQPGLRIADKPHTTETEPNNDFATATDVPLPSVASGRIFSSEGSDEDWFRFEAKAGQALVIETSGARIGSPVDTAIEVRDSSGQSIVRTLLQAVRDSAVTFRPIDSITIDCRVDNWEEMELNEYLYLQGEVVRIFRMPQGPDSGFHFYTLNGKRRNYFDTTATVHANGEPCYTVEPHPPGTKLVPNGLPVFDVFYENDDESNRMLGTDSRVHFTAPSDGVYHVRVRDTRGFSGDRFQYELTIREARPDFTVSLAGANPRIAPGSGQSFTVTADRIDGFDEDITVEISGLPPGFTVSTPIVIQSGHNSAFGTLNAAPDAAEPPPESAGAVKIVASARVGGTVVTREVNSLGRIALADSAPLYVHLEASETGAAEIVIAPGQIVPAHLKVRRNGHDERITFAVNNLPHGIIVDNIGLNGVLIPEGQSERDIFLAAARWVPETDRYCYAISNEGGRQTSLPVLIKVRRSSGEIAGK